MDRLTTASLQDWSYLKTRTAFPSRDAVLQMAVRLSFEVPGDIIEFGVFDGNSTRVIRRTASACEKMFPAGARKRIYACDSFEGLREKFENAEVGTFKVTPPRIAGVEIVKGYFEESLTPTLAKEVGRIALASLDADLYSSTLCALRWLTPLVGTGTLLLFDEFIGEKESEKRAFEEWAAETGTKTVTVAEFMREPSGWGNTADRRALIQVVGPGELKRRRPLPGLRQRVERKLEQYPSVHNALRGALRLVSPKERPSR